MNTWYNEIDKKAAEWLRELMYAQQIPGGFVSEEDIKNVTSKDIEGETAHFFAGIGGWPYALRLAKWPKERPVWTGSCPCQPFSTAGRQKGFKDERHLWPIWKELIAECHPPTIFGEQVASPLGRKWLAGVFADLEGMGYAVAGADLCAASVGAPHIRQRLYWCARLDNNNGERTFGPRTEEQIANARRTEIFGMGISNGQGRSEREQTAATLGYWNTAVTAGGTDGKQRRIEPRLQPLAHGIPSRMELLRGYGNAIVPQVAAAFITAVMEVLGI